MPENLHGIIDLLLSKSEQLENEIHEKTDLKDLTSRQLVCIEIVKKEGNPTLSEIAEKLKITKPSATVMVDRLIANDCLVKVKSDADRRSMHVHLTERGHRIADMHEKIHHDFADKLLKNLNETEEEILVSLLKKALSNI